MRTVIGETHGEMAAADVAGCAEVLRELPEIDRRNDDGFGAAGRVDTRDSEFGMMVLV